MPKLTTNFNSAEFKCPVGGEVPPDLLPNLQKLARSLQVLRDALGRPITIISGYRSPEYNKKIDGAKLSQHMYARAADIKVHGMTPAEVHRAIEGLIADKRMDQGGVGLYQTFVHYDVRGERARWFGDGVGRPDSVS
jgi:uncharacterized protein YcbK (DUF882 family)